MGGLILGVKVSPAGDPPAAASSTPKARQLRLLVREKPATRFSPIRMGYLIQEGPAKDTSEPPSVPGAPLVLTRGEPVEIQVVNQLQEPTSVHWHGIELESYYDGVPGWSGGSPQITPLIPPGGTFLARMTPPRAGTFIYHTHWHDVGQLTSGLYGPLVVVEPGQKFDPDVDKVFLISRAGPDETQDPVLLNGNPQPPPLVLKVGTRYRLRFINIGANGSDTTISFLADSKPVQWRAVAKDGWSLPQGQATVRPARQRISVGETYDFEFVAERSAKLALVVTMPFLETQLSQTITVR
jgi:FtsP/CotA-like multicopper oxidase with cupredoxin domain